MKELVSKRTRLKLFTLGVWQISFAAIPIYNLLEQVVMHDGPLASIPWLPLFILLVGPAYSVFAGVLCLRIREAALVNSTICQCMQVPAIISTYLTYDLAFGPGFTLGLIIDESVRLKAHFNLLATDVISLTRYEEVPLFVGVNLIPLFWIYWLLGRIQALRHVRAQIMVESIASNSGGDGKEQSDPVH